MARQTPPREIDTSVELPKKRGESDETRALRALRELRKLDERLEASKKRYFETNTAIANESAALRQSLSPSVTALVDAMQKATSGSAQ